MRTDGRRAKLGPRIGAVLPACALVFTASDAAASPTSKLVYARAPGTETCPDETAFRATVAARTGYDPFFPFAKRTVVTRLDVADRQYRARMEILDARGRLVGEKTFVSTDGDCDELMRTLALAVSLAIDVADEPGAPEPEAPPPEAKVEARDEPPPPLVVAVPSDDANLRMDPDRATTGAPRRARPVWTASLDTRGSLGLGPGPSVGVAVGGGVRGKGWSAGLEGRWDVGTKGAVGSNADVAISVLAGAANACAHVGAAFGCAVASIGRASASSSGITRPASDDALFLAGGARVGAELAMGPRWALRGSLELAAAPLRHAVRIGRDDVYETSLFFASLGVGAVFDF